MTAPQNIWIRWRVRAGYPVALLVLLLARPSRASFLIGATIGIVGLAIRAWAAGFLDKHEALAIHGPYALTRNPLYFGSAILAVGLIIAADSLWAGALVAIYILLFYPAVMRREEAELREKYGDEFTAYSARVPLFWPRLGIAKSSESVRVRFSRQLYSQNHECQAAIGFALGLAVLWAKMQWMK
ncbi:MAG TPA: isoprenylcysteine carboxylmethyltransferase family protein [Candidatus Acidoferrales bacterium]|nr:isoprenylcysteine carboxylmethyltransferase family protein [Candidatus Acidoferrales bacterium]